MGSVGPLIECEVIFWNK